MSLSDVANETGTNSAVFRQLQKDSQAIASIIANPNLIRTEEAVAPAAPAVIPPASSALFPPAYFFSKQRASSKLIVTATANVTGTAAIGIQFDIMVNGSVSGAAYLGTPDANGNVTVAMETEVSGLPAGAIQLALRVTTIAGSTVNVAQFAVTIVAEEVAV